MKKSISTNDNIHTNQSYEIDLESIIKIIFKYKKFVIIYFTLALIVGAFSYKTAIKSYSIQLSLNSPTPFFFEKFKYKDNSYFFDTLDENKEVRDEYLAIFHQNMLSDDLLKQFIKEQKLNFEANIVFVKRLSNNLSLNFKEIKNNLLVYQINFPGTEDGAKTLVDYSKYVKKKSSLTFLEILSNNINNIIGDSNMIISELEKHRDNMDISNSSKIDLALIKMLSKKKINQKILEDISKISLDYEYSGNISDKKLESKSLIYYFAISILISLFFMICNILIILQYKKNK